MVPLLLPMVYWCLNLAPVHGILKTNIQLYFPVTLESMMTLTLLRCMMSGIVELIEQTPIGHPELARTCHSLGNRLRLRYVDLLDLKASFFFFFFGAFGITILSLQKHSKVVR
ncbi:hypothetical protein K438DRAFT_272661 [Mycena galopus ATCC 62051]|nr:hypothetical protein K438DRAFT_272661 [Mycena galopus ATCC 62051]